MPRLRYGWLAVREPYLRRLMAAESVTGLRLEGPPETLNPKALQNGGRINSFNTGSRFPATIRRVAVRPWARRPPAGIRW
jgi:hypothetical protein